MIDPAVLVKEIDALSARGFLRTTRSCSSPSNAHVIFPWHKHLDVLREKARGASAIGTTGRGIGPAYEDKVARRGIRVRDLLDAGAPARAGSTERLAACAGRAASCLAAPAKAERRRWTRSRSSREYAALGERLRPLRGDALALPRRSRSAQGARILFEGAQGTLLDVDHGTYPFVTS